MSAGCDGDPDPVVDAGALDAAPQIGDAATDGGGVCTGDVRMTRLVYNGTPEPTAMPLTQGQIYAVVSFGGCSGTFIADEWILTANHCGVRVGAEVCVGVEPANPNVCFRATEVHEHPDVDMALVRVDAPASTRFPELEPIPIITEEIDSSWFGRTAEAAGYGRQEDGSSGEREFTAEPIRGFEDVYVVIDGMGERGVCFGDSGGPVMVLATDSTVRVLGDLSFGDPSCLGLDRYTRVDRVYPWIESFTGPTAVAGGACGRFTLEGDCMGNTAVWCEEDVLASARCEVGETCGWQDGVGYRCLSGEDPCGGVSAAGECRGETATWCDRGTVRARDCGPCGEICGDVPAVGGIYCAPDPCADIDYLGRCEGDVAVWCADGEVETRDCARDGLVCDYINDRVGYFCGRP